MLRIVEKDCLLSPSAQFVRLAVRILQSRYPTSAEQIPGEEPSLAPTCVDASASSPSKPVMAPSDEMKKVPRLISGADLNAEQVGIFYKLAHMVESTWNNRECQTPTKDANTIAGAAIAHEHPNFFSSECLRRYLVSRQFCEKKAYDMMMSTLHWRSVNVPTSFDPGAFVECMSSRFMEWHGYDACGRPTLYMKSANANLKIPRDLRVAYTVVTLEKGIKIMEPQYSGHDGVEQWNIVVDETGRGSEHSDNKFLSHIAPILTSHYAQRLHRCYVVNPGLMTRIIYGVVKMFLDEGTTSKIKMVSSKKDKKRGVQYVPEMLEDIGQMGVPPEYGGSLAPRLLEEYREYFNSIPLR